MEADFCVEALREAVARRGAPQIVDTDQGSQFSSAEFVAEVKRIGARRSMDDKGCWRDNVFVERLWRSLAAASSAIRPTALGRYRELARWGSVHRGIAELAIGPATAALPSEVTRAAERRQAERLLGAK